MPKAAGKQRERNNVPFEYGLAFKAVAAAEAG